MDDAKDRAAGAEGAQAPSGPEPLQGPHRNQADVEPAGFVPLRLLLQPGGFSVEFTRPEMLVGRHSVADVRLRSPEVSRRHCRFVFADGHWQVFDLSSMNGVWVNGSRVPHAILQNKDILHVGSYDFEVEIGPSTIPMSGAGTQRPDKPESPEPHKKAS
jgi:pSer/pThr/pTyr-binding forkhead associated (FHA) protein